VITSDSAHDFGLCWYEQQLVDDEVTFKRHVIMGSHPAENHYGVLFSELHSVNLADIDGDGLKDIVTGKTYYSHHKQSPLWEVGAVVYWFRLTRTEKGVDWIPYRADTESGIGRQLSVIDINGDGLLDIVVGGMKGAHVLTHKKTTVDEATWAKAQPQVYQGGPPPSTKGAQALRGPKAPILADTGRVAGALEGESLPYRVSAGRARAQPMGKFKGDRWSGDSQLWWTGGRPGDQLEFDLPEKSGTVDVEIVMTCAKDYGVFQLSLDGQPLGPPIDLYHPDVVTTGVLTFSKIKLKAGTHKLTAQIVGANPKAQKGYMFALDYVRLVAEGETFPEPNDCIKATDGPVVTGLVQDENDNALTLQTADGIVVLPRAEIDERELSAKSTMPDNQLRQFSEHKIRSLVAYLTDKQQVPMLATRDNAALLFNGHDLTGWSGDRELWSVADGEIVGRTSGLKHNDWIVSSLTVRDFHLKLEVKLVGNAGNSGIQFRSESDDREVSGYQADIGSGWWGKLYEQHGRALLWGESGEQHVKRGEWNTYEIVAVGSKIQTMINGQLSVDLDDPQGKRQGVIAFQLHSGGKTEVRFRNLSLKVLDPEAKSVPSE
jgi:hypothetical protein